MILRDHILAAANNADDPPFVTLFDTNAKTIMGKLVFKKARQMPTSMPRTGSNSHNGRRRPACSTSLFRRSGATQRWAGFPSSIRAR